MLSKLLDRLTPSCVTPFTLSNKPHNAMHLVCSTVTMYRVYLVPITNEKAISVNWAAVCCALPGKRVCQNGLFSVRVLGNCSIILKHCPKPSAPFPKSAQMNSEPNAFVSVNIATALDFIRVPHSFPDTNLTNWKRNGTPCLQIAHSKLCAIAIPRNVAAALEIK